MVKTREGRREASALQVEVENENDWQQLLSRKGLILADIYSEWCGPCSAMLSTLKTIQLDVGIDAISYAVAKNDHIEDLKRFRGKSEPVWMFLQDGKMVGLMFGAHCPNLRKLILKEVKRTQNDEEPEIRLSVSSRTPEEEARWQKEESVRKAIEEQKRLKLEAEQNERYENFLAQMIFELSEETALVFYPWVFKDEEGKPLEKFQCTPYQELVNSLLKQNFDVQEEFKVELDEETIEKMLVESNVQITPELIAGLSDGKTLAMRLKGRRPHPDWPVPYPFECPKGTPRCPTRAIDDVENYLTFLLTSKEPFLHSTAVQLPAGNSFMERHVYVYEPSGDEEEDFPRTDRVVWVPPQARSKVHVYTTLFSNYMETSHPYEEPVPAPPLCAYKYNASKLESVRDTCANFSEAVEHFGAFEYDKPPIARRIAFSPEDYEKKVKHQTGNEIFVVIVRRINEDVFLSFASIEPYFVTESDDLAQAMVEEYFPEGAEDMTLRSLEIIDSYEVDDEEEEVQDEESTEEEQDKNEENLEMFNFL